MLSATLFDKVQQGQGHTFAERFYSKKRELRPRVQEARANTPTYKGDNIQVKKILDRSLGPSKIDPIEMQKVSNQMRETLGLMNPSIPPDPDGLKDYREFLLPSKTSLEMDESLIDPVQSIDQMRSQFIDSMNNLGAGTHILEPVSRTSAILQTLRPIAVGGAIGVITYKGALRAAATMSGSVFGDLLKSNAFVLSLNIMFVASKTFKSVMDNDYGNWQTLAASPLEVLKRITPALTNTGVFINILKTD